MADDAKPPRKPRAARKTTAERLTVAEAQVECLLLALRELGWRLQALERRAAAVPAHGLRPAPWTVRQSRRTP